MRSHRRFVVATIAICALGALVPPTSTAGSRDDLPSAARQLLASRLRVDGAELDLVSRSRVSLAERGIQLEVFKFLGPDGTVQVQAVEADGSAVDFRQVVAADLRALRARIGRIDPLLAGAIERAPSRPSFPVVVWLREPPVEEQAAGPALSSADAADPSQREVVVQVADRELARVAAARQAEVRTLQVRAARAFGSLARSLQPARSVAAFFGRLSPLQVAQMASFARVSQVELASQAVSRMGIVVEATGARIVYDGGTDGSDAYVGQVEVGGDVETDNPYLDGFVDMDPGAPTCESPHSTFVAGVIHFMAPGTSNFATGSCNGILSQLEARTGIAIDAGAMAVNHSWGETREDRYIEADDRMLEDISINMRRLQIVASGNQGYWVGSPANSRNSLSVGAFNDGDTKAWGDDVMAGFSAWKGPPSLHGDTQKPEVVAPGVNLCSTTESPDWYGDCGSDGTSFATPVYTGLAALVLDADPRLALWPETLKAILMATSINNIEGQARLSERDGVGGPWAPYAAAVAEGGPMGGWTAWNYGCSGGDRTLETVRLPRGRRVRIVLTWNTDPAYSDWKRRPSADLDLVIFGPNGGKVAVSASWDNTYEIVDFLPTVAGDHKIRMQNLRCNKSPRRLGVAYWIAPP